MSTQADSPDSLDPRQLQAIALLAQGASMKDAAQQLGISERSLRRWKNESTFDTELRESIRDVLDELKLKVNPIVLRAERQAIRVMDLNDKMMDSNDSRLVLQACNNTSNNAIRWLKLLLLLDKVETGRQLATATRMLKALGEEKAAARAADARPLRLKSQGSTPANEPQSSASEGAVRADHPAVPSPAPVPPSPSTERGPGGEVKPAASTVSASVASSSDSAARATKHAESGQKRTSDAAAPSGQTQAGEKVNASYRVQKAVSAPNPVAQASSLRVSPAGSRRDVDSIIAAVTAEIARNRVRRSA